MKRYTDEELERLLSDIESDISERKESFSGDAPNSVREAVCAMANDLPDHRECGVVFIGARNDGNPSGLQITDQLLQNIGDVKTDGNIVPPPTISLEKRLVRGAEMAVLTIAPSDSPPVRYRGRTWIRIGPRRAVASLQDERVLTEKRRYRNIPFDLQPVEGTTLADLSRRLFEEEYLPGVVSPELLSNDERSFEEQLATCKMIAATDNLTPTVVGLLTLGIRTRDVLPGAYIQFLRIDGNQLGDPVLDEATVDGPLSQIVRIIDEKLNSHIRTSVGIKGGIAETRTPDYPIEALRQLVRNAILHRAYEATNAPTRIYWFNDFIEIASPGGPFGAVTIENFGQPGVTDYRNPNIAEALRAMGFVQRFGFGIQIARRELHENGNPELELEITANNVLFRLRAKTSE